jgi:hypothetical protein
VGRERNGGNPQIWTSLALAVWVLARGKSLDLERAFGKSPCAAWGFPSSGSRRAMFGSGRGSVGSIGGTRKAKDLREVEDSGGQWQVNLCQDKSRGVAVVSLPHRAGRSKPRLQLPYPDEYDLPL